MNENILFYGSSGGGFSSIQLGTLIKNSNVLINNAQFFVLNFYKNPVEKLFNFLNKSFGGDENIFELIDYRLDVIELFKKEEYVPRIIYYVNTESKDDICNQYIPFLEKLFNLPFFKNDFHVCFYKEYKEEVHSPLPTNESIKIIKQWINTNSLFNESFGNFEPKINVGFYSFLIPKGYKVHILILLQMVVLHYILRLKKVKQLNVLIIMLIMLKMKEKFLSYLYQLLMIS